MLLLSDLCPNFLASTFPSFFATFALFAAVPPATSVVFGQVRARLADKVMDVLALHLRCMEGHPALGLQNLGGFFPFSLLLSLLFSVVFDAFSATSVFQSPSLAFRCFASVVEPGSTGASVQSTDIQITVWSTD